MGQNHYQILLIEDDSATIQLIQNLLEASPPSSLANTFSVETIGVPSLKEAVKICEDQQFDIILLDLFLPDIQGLEALVEARKNFPDRAIIAYSQSEDEYLVIQAFQHGADGYLRLKSLDSYLLYYELLSVLERQTYRQKKEDQQSLASQQTEYQNLETLIDSNTSITARMFGSETIKDSLPELFEELKQDYGELIDLALEQRIFRVDYDLSDKLRNLADRLGFMKASPRDVIEIHTTSLRDKSRDINIVKSQAYVVEGRLMVLELMGYLASFYRKYYIGLNNLKISSRLPTKND